VRLAGWLCGVTGAVALTARSAFAEEASEPVHVHFELRDHFDFIWRSLRRLGLDDARADDAAQEVFVVASRKRDEIEPGRERAFLFGTALRVAADSRRSLARRREVSEEEAPEVVDAAPSPEALLDQRRARAVLDEMLDELPQDVRAVFVLYELEELEMQESAALLSVPQGTVASRLRRARTMFAAAVKRRQARAAMLGGGR
jgi:RNA polymerase sigma-70 factor (ECF subfamily)